MMDSENLEAHSDVFQGKMTYLTRQLMLAINNFLANISNILCFTSWFRQMSPGCVDDISEIIYTFPNRIASKQYQTVMLATMQLNANISCCLKEADWLSNLLFYIEIRLMSL